MFTWNDTQFQKYTLKNHGPAIGPAKAEPSLMAWAQLDPHITISDSAIDTEFGPNFSICQPCRAIFLLK